MKDTLFTLKHQIDELGVRAGVRSWIGHVRLQRMDEAKWDAKTVFDYGSWDVLVVIDACRYDLWKEVEDEYDYVSTTESRMSVASCTWQWLPNLVDEVGDDRLEKTAYVTGNPQSDLYLSGQKFGFLDEVWRDNWDEKHGTVLPRAVTDRAISYWRDRSETIDKMIVHYMQPHTPFVDSEDSPKLTHDNFRSGEDVSDDWVLAAQGHRDLDAVWRDYRENLRLALDDIGVLLDNLDAQEPVITSDHGNAVGEYGIYGHPDVPHPKLREVPWVQVTASDLKSREPKTPDKENIKSVDSKLQALGYK